VSARVERRRYRDADVEDTAVCTVRFPSAAGEIRLTWAGAERRTKWAVEGDRGSLELDDDRLTVRNGAETSQFVLPESLSNGSHHPEWFGAVIEEFMREIEGTERGGAKQAEAELCLLLTHLAYTSAARDGAPVAVPAGAPGDTGTIADGGRAALGPDLLQLLEPRS